MTRFRQSRGRNQQPHNIRAVIPWVVDSLAWAVGLTAAVVARHEFNLVVAPLGGTGVAALLAIALQTAAIGRDGEALVLEMGAPVRISEVARQMAENSGSSVDIVFTGLRRGEKLHEELFGDGEHGVRPLHQLISHVAVPPLDPRYVRTLNPYARRDELIADLARLCGDPHLVSVISIVDASIPGRPSAFAPALDNRLLQR